MKPLTLFAGIALLGIFACTESEKDLAQTTAASTQLQLLTEANPEWQFENLRIYPIVADAAALQSNAALPNLKTLTEAMKAPNFRIMERKQFGRSEDWRNALTVQNKTQDTVFLMSGDVVTGGNQDRVIAYDNVVLPGTVKNLEVFCVEAGRSHYYDENAPQAEKQVGAFRGYYNVASPQVRTAVFGGKQNEVWDAVAKVTAANDATSDTHAYAALETANEKKEKREAYLRFFDGKFNQMPNVIGMVAVSNGKVVGVDIFGKPDLFRQQYQALLHGYAAEAVMGQNSPSPATATVQQAFDEVARLAQPGTASNEKAGKFGLNGGWVHLFGK